MALSSKTPKYSSNKAEHLEARLSHGQKVLIQQAADLSARSLTDFVIHASQKMAEEVIRNHKLITLTQQESQRFADALMNAGKLPVALKKASQSYRAFKKRDME